MLDSKKRKEVAGSRTANFGWPRTGQWTIGTKFGGWSTKEFYIHVKYADARARETPEIDWRGRVYVGRVQALAEAASLPNDADPNDIYLTDSRGDHTGWVLLASRFETITGLPSTSLAKLWETGPHLSMGRGR